MTYKLVHSLHQVLRQEFLDQIDLYFIIIVQHFDRVDHLRVQLLVELDLVQYLFNDIIRNIFHPLHKVELPRFDPFRLIRHKIFLNRKYLLHKFQLARILNLANPMIALIDDRFVLSLPGLLDIFGHV